MQTKYQILNKVKKLREIYRAKWKRDKDKRIWEICPELMTHAHLRHKPVIDILSDIIKMFEENNQDDEEFIAKHRT